MPVARFASWRVLRAAALPLLLTTVVLSVATPDHSAAQGRVVRLEGRVLWVAGDVLSLAVNDGPAVSIDLSNVAQSDYSGLSQGEWVVVFAQLSRDYRRLNGTSITRYPGSQAP